MTKAEKVRQAASDMGFDDERHMLDFLDGVGLEVVEKEPSHTTRAKLALKQARETFVLSAAIAFATHPRYEQEYVSNSNEITARPYMLTPEDAANEAVALWNAVQKALAEQFLANQHAELDTDRRDACGCGHAGCPRCDQPAATGTTEAEQAEVTLTK